MSTKFQVIGFIAVFSTLVEWSLASITCSKGQYRNSNSCSPCSGCPLGYGVRTPCAAERDTECQPCTQDYDYSNTTGMEPCILCDVNSNCPWGKSRIVKNCTITSPALCLGCADGSVFHPDIGPNGACLEWPRFPPRSTSDQKTVNKSDSSESQVERVLVIATTTAILAIVLVLFVVFFVYCKTCHKKRGESCAPAKDVEGQTAATFQSSYSEPAPKSSRKVTTSSPNFHEEPDFLKWHEEPCKTMHVAAEGIAERKSKGGIETTDFTSSKNNSSVSAEISRTRNISSPPKNVDPEMAARRSVDHNGGKLTRDNTEVSLNIQSENPNFDFLPPLKEHSMTIGAEAPPKEPHETIGAVAESKFERGREWEHEKRRYTTSNNSVASDVSHMMWNISKLPQNIDPKMVAWALMDHKGGKLTIGDTGVSLTIPPLAIPEGRTEEIFIAIMNQEKEHLKVTSKEPLLSPVVSCGPTGLKFDRHVILSMPHGAVLGEGSCNLKVHYNESDSGRPADWKELVDDSKQDGSAPYLAIVERNVVHIVVDHFTLFGVTGEQPGSTKQAMKSVKIVAYVTQPEAGGDCIVRIYGVLDTPAHLEAVHNQEVGKLGGVAKDIKPFHLKEGGSDVLVQVTNFHSGWTTTLGDNKVIDLEHIWEGVERMPCCTFLFSSADKDVTQFRAAFEVKQVDCQDDKLKQEIIVSTGVKHSRARFSSLISSSDSNNDNLMPEQVCACTSSASSTALLDAGLFANPNKSTFEANVLLGANAAGQKASPIRRSRHTSDYYSFGFEPLAFTHVLSRSLYCELIILLDPPHSTKANWKNLAEDLGFQMKHIRWLEYRTSPTFILLTYMEAIKYPLYKLAEILRKEGRDDAAELMEDQLKERETSV